MQMDLPSERNPCRNCGCWGYEHNRTKVFGDGRWHWEYPCPKSDDASLRERLGDRVGVWGDALADAYEEYLAGDGR